MTRPDVLLRLSVMLLLLAGGACGGSSSGDDEDPPADPPPAAVPTSIELLDALPSDDSTQVDPGLTDVTLSHFGHADFTTAVGGDCASGTTIERALIDVSVDFDALFEHGQVCRGLNDNGAVETVVEATRETGETFTTGLGFATTTRTAPGLQVQDAVTTPRDSMAELFHVFVDDSLLDELDVPEVLKPLVAESVEALADDAYGELLGAEPIFDVTAQRVTYASRRPDGSASSELTGLVVVPDSTSSGFAPKESVIVLSHSTGVTPSDLEVSNGWYVVARLFAARGYLVIAPDNWGRGGTSSEPETFLMATRTAANSLDLIRAVLDDPQYDAARSSGTPRITIVGYSQGGHTALALWRAIATQEQSIHVPEVYAGAGPYNLFATARGVVQHASGACDGGVYCRYVTDETTVPFLSERVLPGYVEYGARELMLGDLVEDETLTAGFVEGFLGNDPAIDALKGLLQQSSFTNVTDGLEALGAAGTRFTLFHSEFDRLVPIANTEELVSVLDPHFAVDFRREACNSGVYESVFDATTRVGISHTLCGFEMLNDVYEELR